MDPGVSFNGLSRAVHKERNRDMENTFPAALTIAGSDSGGGAGIQADLRTFSVLHVYGCSAVTALTAQNPKGVSGIFPVSPEFLCAQISAVLSAFPVKAVKTGMLFSSDLIEAAVDGLSDYPGHIVVDPVMVSTSGSRLLRDDAVETMKKHLLPKAYLITPNRFEAEILAGIPIRNFSDMKRAASICHEKFGCGVVVKGGHSDNPETAEDFVYLKEEQFTLRASRLELPELTTHGTGCTFSAAAAAGLAKGLSCRKALEEAKLFVWSSLKTNVASGSDFHSMFPLAYLKGD